MPNTRRSYGRWDFIWSNVDLLEYGRSAKVSASASVSGPGISEKRALVVKGACPHPGGRASIECYRCTPCAKCVAAKLPRKFHRQDGPQCGDPNGGSLTSSQLSALLALIPEYAKPRKAEAKLVKVAMLPDSCAQIRLSPINRIWTSTTLWSTLRIYTRQTAQLYLFEELAI